MIYFSIYVKLGCKAYLIILAGFVMIGKKKLFFVFVFQGIIIYFIGIIEMDDYTPAIGRRLNIKAGAILFYSLTLLGLGLFLLFRYKYYSASDYHNCQFRNFKTNIYIISVANLICGLLIASASIVQLAAIREWSVGQISSRDFWRDYYQEYNSKWGLILFVLQISVIGFATSNEFRVFTPSYCDPYVYYAILVNVDGLYNILLIGVAVYLTGYLIFGVLYGLWSIISEIGALCCIDIRLGNYGFGLFVRGRIRTSQISQITNQITIPIPNGQNNDIPPQLVIHTIIPDGIEFTEPDECVICINPQKKGVKFSNCTHWVCEVCWSRLMLYQQPCPLCREKIV